MKVVKLTIDEDSEFEGIDAVALVEEPAIEVDFHAFSNHEFKSFDDYPKAAIEAAEQGIKRNKELGNKCGTLVGKQRAQQLANGRPISLDVIKRMRSFLIRQKDNYDLAISRKDYDACGYISYLLWGGPAALPWAEKKLRQAGLLEEANQQIFEDYFSEENGSINDGKYFDDMDADVQELLLKALEKRGISNDTLTEDGWEEITEDSFNNHLYFAIITSEPEAGSLQDTNNYRILYKYEGPKDSKNRKFCRQILDKNLLYRLEDINNMSLEGANSEFSTYDIFTYKGSYNCRHRWVQKFYRKNKPLDEQKRSTTTNNGPREVIGGPRAQEASQTNPKSRTLGQILEGVPANEWTFSAVNEDKMLLAGPLMIADKLIPRIDEEGNKYYVFFDADGIKKLSYKLMKNKLIDSINIEHDPNRKVDDISLVETWLVEDSEKDKSSLYGYNLNKGSWFGIYKVNNKSVWDDYVKTGRVKGFSVEGLFNDKIIMNNAIAN
jgi:hypothetical protein